MTIAYTAQQVRAAEAALISAGVPLMQRAADALAAEIEALDASHRSVLLLVGSGDNGGDALFAGARLAAARAEVVILSTGSRMHAAGLAAALDAGARVEALDPFDADAVGVLAARASVIVDGILGTGTSPDAALRGRARDTVAAILPVLAASDPPRVVAVDLPSGIHPDTGAVSDPAVLSAEVTVTFGGVKTGLLRSPGSDYVGRIVLAEIGLGAELAKSR